MWANGATVINTELLLDKVVCRMNRDVVANTNPDIFTQAEVQTKREESYLQNVFRGTKIWLQTDGIISSYLLSCWNCLLKSKPPNLSF